MSAAEYDTNKEKIILAIANSFDVHPSMIIVTVKSSRRRSRRLTGDGDQVILVVQIFVTPAKAPATEDKVNDLKTVSGSSNFSNKIERDAGIGNTLTISVTCTKCTIIIVVNQTPPLYKDGGNGATTPNSGNEGNGDVHIKINYTKRHVKSVQLVHTVVLEKQHASIMHPVVLLVHMQMVIQLVILVLLENIMTK